MVYIIRKTKGFFFISLELVFLTQSLTFWSSEGRRGEGEDTEAGGAPVRSSRGAMPADS